MILQSTLKKNPHTFINCVSSITQSDKKVSWDPPIRNFIQGTTIYAIMGGDSGTHQCQLFQKRQYQKCQDHLISLSLCWHVLLVIHDVEELVLQWQSCVWPTNTMILWRFIWFYNVIKYDSYLFLYVLMICPPQQNWRKSSSFSCQDLSSLYTRLYGRRFYQIQFKLPFSLL